MTTVDALHELRRMAQPVCWRCEGSGTVREARNGWERDECPSCDGTGSPERTEAASAA